MAMNSINYSLCTFRAADDAMLRGGGVADWNYEARCMYGGAVESSGSGSGSSSDDILALLPSDPFGMEELSNSLSAAFYGLIDDLDDDIDADLDYYWSQALAYSSSEPSDCSWVETEIPGLLLPCMDDLPGWFCGSWVREGFQGVAGASSSVTVRDREEEEAECSGGGVGMPHEALLFALGYLDLKDLLTAEMVCKTLRSTVQGDPLLWRRIHVDSPLNKRITDDDLLRLTERAQGSLECLSLQECTNITDEGLKNVLVSNLKLKKLGIDGCVRLTIVGLICNLKIFNSLAESRINYLKLGSCNVSLEQFEELRSLVDGEELARHHKPRYYHERIHRLQPCDDDCWMDIEFCPLCQQHKLVFDCPLESCRGKKIELCRGCEFCIFRCVQCGRCIIGDCVYVETFFLQYLCGDCWVDAPLTPEPQEE